MDTIKFIKSHIPLCAGTLGLAVLGYLGYHAVKWIVAKCSKTEKVTNAASNALNVKNSVPKKLDALNVNKNAVLQGVKVPEGKITTGHGEYLLFKKGTNGQNASLSPELYERAYQVLNDWTPQAIVRREGPKAAELCSRRAEIIQAKLKEIDPDIEAVFIPKTLYELVLLRKCIREDLKQKKICKGVDHRYDREELAKEKAKCWHLCAFKDLGGDNQHPRVKEVAYRLNQVMLKTFAPTSQGFTLAELRDLTEKESQFLRRQYKEGCAEMSADAQDSIGNCNHPGPTTNFRYESIRGQIKPMGIRGDEDTSIIQNAVTLECSDVAKRAFFLYRGARFEEDLPYSSDAIRTKYWEARGIHLFSRNDKPVDETIHPYSLSYGSSLFAGAVYDGGATAFHFIRNQPNAYVVSIPFEQMLHTPFYLPETNTIVQFYSHGEVFHGRTKVWQNADISNRLKGVQQVGSDTKHLLSELSQEALCAEFMRYKTEAIHLK